MNKLINPKLKSEVGLMFLKGKDTKEICMEIWWNISLSHQASVRYMIRSHWFSLKRERPKTIPRNKKAQKEWYFLKIKDFYEKWKETREIAFLVFWEVSKTTIARTNYYLKNRYQDLTN